MVADLLPAYEEALFAGWPSVNDDLLLGRAFRSRHRKGSQTGGDMVALGAQNPVLARSGRRRRLWCWWLAASRGMLFYRLLQQAVVTAPVTYADVIQSNNSSAS